MRPSTHCPTVPSAHLATHTLRMGPYLENSSFRSASSRPGGRLPVMGRHGKGYGLLKRAPPEAAAAHLSTLNSAAAGSEAGSPMYTRAASFPPRLIFGQSWSSDGSCVPCLAEVGPRVSFRSSGEGRRRNKERRNTHSHPGHTRVCATRARPAP